MVFQAGLPSYDQNRNRVDYILLEFYYLQKNELITQKKTREGIFIHLSKYKTK